MRDTAAPPDGGNDGFVPRGATAVTSGVGGTSDGNEVFGEGAATVARQGATPGF